MRDCSKLICFGVFWGVFLESELLLLVFFLEVKSLKFFSISFLPEMARDSTLTREKQITIPSALATMDGEKAGTSSQSSPVNDDITKQLAEVLNSFQNPLKTISLIFKILIRFHWFVCSLKRSKNDKSRGCGFNFKNRHDNWSSNTKSSYKSSYRWVARNNFL